VPHEAADAAATLYRDALVACQAGHSNGHLGYLSADLHKDFVAPALCNGRTLATRTSAKKKPAPATS
jgi:hypothetical protein